MTLAIICICIIITPLLIAVIRTALLRHAHKQKLASRPTQIVEPPQDTERAALHLGEAVTFRTVSAGHPDWSQFEALHQWIRATYPTVHSQLDVRYVGHNIIVTYPGSDTSLLPVLLTAHQDVVPAGDEQQWTHPPFEGQIHDGYVWGRGTFDVKIQMVAVMEAFESLLLQGYVPNRTYMAAFGCDEEVSGPNGAIAIARVFEAEGMRFSMVLDEGGAVAERYIPGLENPVAAIGIAEKGLMNVQMSVSLDGGHSSTPKNPTSLGVIAQAAASVEQHKAKVRYTQPVRELFYNIGLESSFGLSLLFLNFWLFRPLLTSILSKNPTLNSFLRTTHATTMAQGSDAANIIPRTSTAVVNFRLLPGDTEQSVISWLQRVVKDRRVTLSTLLVNPPSAVSPTDTPQFAALTNAVRDIFPTAIPTSYLMMGGTDAKRYEAVCDCIYRLTPVQMDKTEIGRMHGYDERISVQNVNTAVQFFCHLIKTY